MNSNVILGKIHSKPRRAALARATLAMACSFAALAPIQASHAQDSVLVQLGNGIADRWNKSMAGDNDLYVPFYTWHNRFMYTREAIDSFNEMPWGLGYGRSYHDENGNWQGFYAMAFKDSHSRWQPTAGYGSTWDWYTADRNWHVGVGYTIFLTARADIFNYVPFPAALPLVSAGYKNFTVQGTYIPGKRNRGNVAFFWAKYAF